VGAGHTRDGGQRKGQQAMRGNGVTNPQGSPRPSVPVVKEHFAVFGASRGRSSSRWDDLLANAMRSDLGSRIDRGLARDLARPPQELSRAVGGAEGGDHS
jgi:hypothetical protein